MAPDDDEEVTRPRARPPVPTPVRKSTERLSEPVDHDGPTEPSLRGSDLAASDGGLGLPAADSPLGDLAALGDLDLEGTVIDGRYAVLHELGRGGMGTVYVGEHLELRIPVAIKVMLPTYAVNDHWLRRFRREARATSALSHRNIVRVLDFGTYHGLPYIVMELLRGQALSDWLVTRPAPPSMQEVARVMEQIFDAFEAAHGAGIIHRDLKPDNVFMALESDGEVVAKILDFGLAYMDERGEATLTNADMVSGTPEYMSPEQCRSLRVSAESDIYAMGCLLTELLQLRPPFGGQTHVDVMTKQMFYEPPPLDRPPGSEPVPPLLEALRLDMLAKRPARRPASVAEARARFRRALDPVASAAALPHRKEAPTSGDREGRLPTWSEAEPAPIAPRADTPVAVRRLAKSGWAVDDVCVMAMRLGGLKASVIESDEEAAALAVTILDAGDEVEAAIDTVRRIGDRSRCIVILRRVTPEAMSELIGAGAALVMSQPLEPTQLAKKAQRQLARARPRD
ncbi:MAG: serine/threonine-protein kinase [Polyangiaceae bacterium]